MAININYVHIELGLVSRRVFVNTKVYQGNTVTTLSLLNKLGKKYFIIDKYNIYWPIYCPDILPLFIKMLYYVNMNMIC